MTGRGLPIRDWDRLIAPVLQRIEIYAGTLNQHASICQEYAHRVAGEVRNLAARPEWETRAAESMLDAFKRLKDAEAILSEATKIIGFALVAYEEIKIDGTDNDRKLPRNHRP